MSKLVHIKEDPNGVTFGKNVIGNRVEGRGSELTWFANPALSGVSEDKVVSHFMIFCLQEEI